MLKINYKGYEISQADNNHVVICKDKQMLFHSQCNKKLDEEELKKQLEFYLKLNCLNLIEENQQLKKQLEEYQLQNINLREDIMIQKIAFPNKLIKDKTFYNLYDMPTYEELLAQQKEFIKYLEDNWNTTQDIWYIKILQKYKSIIGDDK